MPQRFTEEFKQMILDLANTDMPLIEIADNYHIAVSTIANGVKQRKATSLK